MNLKPDLVGSQPPTQYPRFTQLGSPSGLQRPIVALEQGPERANLGRPIRAVGVRMLGPSAPAGGVTHSDRPLMTRIFRSVGFVLALATAGLGLGAFAWTTGGPAAAQGGGFTPLPPGWELCVLEGVGAPATAANVADLDEWQAAEGGLTNNTAAFNPYNTGRTTDNTGASIAGAVDSANGFPAFPSWAAGCSATIATLFQPNMWVIDAALRAGNVSPPTAFLAVVDQSAWCAPSPNGVPCYVDAMEVSPGSLALAIPASSALNV